MLGSALFGLAVMSLVRGQPYPIPPTCYQKVLDMAKDISHRAAQIKSAHDTWRCTAHLPDLYVDVHNACVMSSMGSYLSALDGLRQRRCAYTRNVQDLRATIRQLYIIIAQKCHGDLVFTYDNCAALERRSTGA